MKNYLMLNNKKIELTPEQVKEIENSFGFNRIKLSDIDVGDTFKVGKLEFIVLEHHDETTSVILKEFWKTAKFDGDFNDYKESAIRKELNTEFVKLLSDCIGSENIVEHKVDLTADDGRVDYESCYDLISLLICDMYRKYVYVLDKHKINKWWWLATAYSTKSNGHTTTVRCVDNSGSLNYDNCSYCDGVRPFCILKSNIFVSK